MDTLPMEEIANNNSNNNINGNKDDANLMEKSLKIKGKEKLIEEAKPALVMSEETASVLYLCKPKKPAEAKKLKKKLTELSAENETLKKSLEERSEEVVELKRTVESLNDVLNSVPLEELRNGGRSAVAASDKALDLSKKQRQLQAELVSAKSKASKKEIELRKLEREMVKLQEQLQQQSKEDTSKAQLLELETKLRAMQQKLFETRNRNTELQSQLKLAHKCLEQELGDSSININTLASSGTSTWRGRAQQIIHLQQKLQEMRERIEKYEAEGVAGMAALTLAANTNNIVPMAPSSARLAGAGAGGDSEANVIVAGHAQAAALNNNTLSYDRITPSVRRNELQHRAKVELLEKEIGDLKTELEVQRNKVLALKVRNKTLNDEMLKYKSKANALEEQTGGFGTINLVAMNEQLNMQKVQFENRLEEINAEMAAMKRQQEEAAFKEAELQSKLGNAEDMLTQRDAHIEELLGVIEKLESDIKSLCGDFLFSCRELRKEEFIAILDSLEAEKNYLMEENKKNSERLRNERTKTEALTEQVNKQKIRISRLEGKIREMERELESESEKKKRFQRMAEYANSISSSGATANGSVSSFVFENSSTIGGGRGNNSTGAITSREDSAKAAELKNQLELCKEKIKILEEKVTYLKQEKDSDAKAFEETIANSKHLILKTILSCRSKATTSPLTSASESTTPRSRSAPSNNTGVTNATPLTRGTTSEASAASKTGNATKATGTSVSRVMKI